MPKGEIMNTARKQSDLYWDGGALHTQIDFSHLSMTLEDASNAIAFLEEFQSLCHKHYFCLHSALLGQRHIHYRFGRFVSPENLDKDIWIGAGPPDSAQIPGRSTVGKMRQREFLESLQRDGEFANYHAKAFVVFVYHIWDESYRKRIADTLSIEKDRVECTLMGDIRKVRNLILHEDSVIPAGFSSRLEILAEIWNLEPGHLRITESMVHSFMEQLMAIRLTIAGPQS